MTNTVCIFHTELGVIFFGCFMFLFGLWAGYNAPGREKDQP